MVDARLVWGTARVEVRLDHRPYGVPLQRETARSERKTGMCSPVLRVKMKISKLRARAA